MTNTKAKTLIIITLLWFLVSTNSAAIPQLNAETIKPVIPYAALSANKYIEKTNLTIGEKTLVMVNITNFGNLSATNIKIEEPLVPVGIVKLEKQPHLDTLYELKPNASYVYYYEFKAEALGDYFIPPTKVTWTSNGTEYSVSSQGYTIHVYQEIVVRNVSKDWWILFGISVGVVLLPAIPIVIKKYLKK